MQLEKIQNKLPNTPNCISVNKPVTQVALFDSKKGLVLKDFCTEELDTWLFKKFINTQYLSFFQRQENYVESSATLILHEQLTNK